MTNLLTATDLEDWSKRRDAEGNLPTLLRRLIMATASPSEIRVAAAEGVRSPGFDGVIDVPGGAPPYVPAARSVWEMGTGDRPGSKAASDYKKRTRETPATDRAVTTFVFLTSRPWDRAQTWARSKAAGGDGWADVKALDAQDLATWLETCPGVEGWLRHHLGHQPFGITALRDWFADWTEKTEPPLPTGLVLCGRSKEAAALVEALDGHPDEHIVATRGRDEATAFIAAALLTTPVVEEREGADGDGAESAPPPDEEPASNRDAATVAADATEADDVDAFDRAAVDAARREALLERAVVVHDEGAWRRWSAHEQPMILIPLFEEPAVDVAVRGGHHVVLPQTAQSGQTALPPLHRGHARSVWESAGIAFPQADELARAARRSLTSLRRRIGRTGRFRRPMWAEGTSANLLAPLLLAGAWIDDIEGDRQLVTRLADRATWRGVARDLAPLTIGDDAPLAERNHHWEFLDIVDAWDALSPTLTSEDLDLFHELAIEVLTEPDPLLQLSTEERRTAAYTRGGLPRRRHSGLLRRGLTNTLAVLGAVAGDRELPGGSTGEEHAALAVHKLLDDASTERWMSVADLLPVLAEASPSVFLDALENSLRTEAHVMALFVDEDNPLGMSSSSRHTSLLWALEALAFSPQHVSRVAVVLGQLAERDPGGRLSNRPAASLQAILHLLHPQSAVSRVSRIHVVDAVRRATPTAAWKLVLSLIESVERGMILHHGPRFRDWPRPDRDPTYAALIEAIDALATRIADDAGRNGERWTSAMALVDRVPPAARQRMLDALGRAWDDLDADAQRKVFKALDDRVNRHLRHRGAAWALDAQSVASLQTFLSSQAVPGTQPADHDLFSWWPKRLGLDAHTDEGQAALAAARTEALGRALSTGLDGLIALAAEAEVPESIGITLASMSRDLDGAVLDYLGDEAQPMHRVAYALARARREADDVWLHATTHARPGQAVDVLLAVDIDDGLLDLVDALPNERRDDFWRRMRPWRVPDDLVTRVCEQLLQRGRPVWALWVLEHADKEAFRADLAIEALRAAALNSEERLEVLHSPTYVIGQLLDKVEESGAGTELLAQLEWLYSPILHDERDLIALNRSLATDPSFFAQLVSFVYRKDSSEDEESADASAAEIMKEGEHERAADEAEEAVEPHVMHAAWSVLREWRSPLPGSPDGSMPSSEQAQAWVTQTRGALAALGRIQIGAIAIGEALSGPATDADGTWPSTPVRDVLEREQDHRLEHALVLGRFNQRGVTMRSVYAGGEQERKLAAQYREWAEKVRDDWPRAGAVLDELVRIYEADARREDTSAAVQADR